MVMLGDERTDNNKLMIIGGEIIVVYLKRIVLDLEASISIMSRDIQKTHQFNLRKSNTRVLMANNQEAKVFGETNRLRINIKGHMSRINFTVIEGCEYDILLGMDYFNKTRVGIFHS
jgi:hypothetical protein